MPVTSQWIFTAIVFGVIGQRMLEMTISKRHLKQLIEQGAVEHSDNWLPAVKLLQVSWWIGMLVEVWMFDRPFIPSVAVVAGSGLLLGQLLRYLSMQALQERWTLTIATLPDESAVAGGIYRYLRHPNWLGVILEIAALPLFHCAYVTAITCTVLNAWLMSQRISAEEQALNLGSNYAEKLGDRPRLWPRLSGMDPTSVGER